MHYKKNIVKHTHAPWHIVAILIFNFLLISNLIGQSNAVSFEFDQLNCDLDSTLVVVCDDFNPCSTQDVQYILASDSTICVPCAGQNLDCITGPTTIIPCDDANPLTINDQEILLDCDGSICVPCAGVADSTVAVSNILDPLLFVYPNPTYDILNLRLESTTRFSSNIFDQNGKLVFSENNGKSQIDLSHLKRGIYWLEILVLSDQRVIRKSVIKM